MKIDRDKEWWMAKAKQEGNAPIAAGRVQPMSDGRPLYYVLDESGEARPWQGGLIEWSDEVGRLEREGKRWLKRTEVAGTEVVTAFLPIDDAAATCRPGPPAVFGTIVWADRQEFFDSTRAAALARHERVVEKLREGKSLEDEHEQPHQWNASLPLTNMQNVCSRCGAFSWKLANPDQPCPGRRW